MLFNTNGCVAIRCMECGKFAMHTFTLFDLHHAEVYKINCDCGKHMISLKSKKCKTFQVYYPCAICNKEHVFTITSRHLLTEKLRMIECPVSRAELAYIGNQQLVEDVVNKYEKDLQELIDVLI